MKRAIITAIDRDRNTVSALPYPFFSDAQDAPTPIVAGYTGEPPTPLCPANFDDALRVCLGSVTPALPVFHEDFNSGYYLNFTMQCDTYWPTVAGNPIDGTSTIIVTANLGLGVARFVAAGTLNASCVMIKQEGIVAMASADAFWQSSRFMLENLPGGEILFVGMLTNDGTSRLAAVVYSTTAGPNWLNLVGDDGAHQASTDTGIPVVAGQWVWVDILTVPGAFQACWINGAGPFFVGDATTTPARSRGLAPALYVANTNGAGGQRRAQWDNYTLRSVYSKGIAHPSTLPL